MNVNTTERLAGLRRSLSLAFAALVAGSRSIPLGDNGSLLRELAHRSAEPTLPWKARAKPVRP